jgi:hypothetical protein
MARRTSFGSRVSKVGKSTRGATPPSVTPVTVRARVTLPGSLDAVIRDRLAAKLARHALAIERITVRFDDINGPRGGVDTECEIKVVVRAAPSVIVSEKGTTPALAFNGALSRVVKVVRRDLERRGGTSRAPAAQGGNKSAVTSGAAQAAPATSTATRNLRNPRSRMTVTLEDSAQRPSRKSTRRSVNRAKPSHGKERTAVAREVAPTTRARKGKSKGGRPARG